MFLCEVGQSGIFQIRNVPTEDIDPILGVACPNILFPYAREAVSSVVNRAGFRRCCCRRSTSKPCTCSSVRNWPKPATPEAKPVMKRLVYPLALSLGLLAHSAAALEFRSVKETGVALYEAPALTSKKLFVVSRYYPVEVLSSQKEWSRVRDATGGIAWIPAAALSKQRWLLITVDKAEVRATPANDGLLAYTVPKDGVVELQEPPKGGWVKVRHRDGSIGYARITDLWGL